MDFINNTLETIAESECHRVADHAVARKVGEVKAHTEESYPESDSGEGRKHRLLGAEVVARPGK